MLGRIKVSRLVDDVGGFRHDSEAVSKSPRNPQHEFVLAGKCEGFPFAEGGRALTEVERNIKYLASDGADQFSLRLTNLVVQTADNIFFGIRMIVLHKRLWNAEI